CRSEHRCRCDAATCRRAGCVCVGDRRIHPACIAGVRRVEAVMNVIAVDSAFVATLIAASLRIATPILFAALGEAVAESAGILNVGIEGMMVIGAVSGFLVSYAAGDQWLGFAAAFAFGGLSGLLFGYITVERGADHVVTGIVFNIFCFGLASLCFKALFARAS